MPAPRKPTRDRKSLMLRIRVTKAHKRRFAAAATRSGLTLSSWLVERALRAASIELTTPFPGSTMSP
jgi:uncharacterized protein (DUF1778 family)